MHHWIQKTVLAATLLSVSAPASAFSEAGESFHYFVEGVTGEVYAWSNVETGWEKVKERAKLADGTIIQSNGSMRLVAVRTAEGSKEKGQQIVVEAQGSVMFRVTPQLSREFELANYFVKKSSELEAPSLGDQQQNLSLQDAWEKVLALVSSRNTPKKSSENLNFGKGKPQEALAEVEGTELTISYPAKGGVFVPDQFPMEIPVVWTDPDPRAGQGTRVYEVYAKTISESQYARVGKSKERTLRLLIEKEGSYSVMVRSVDGAARSEEMLFNVYPPDAEVWKKVPSKKR